MVTPFANGVGGTIFSKWDLTEGNNTTLTDQLPNILAGQSYINFHTRRLPGGEVRGQIEENPQVTANIHKVFSYGLRNSFGFDFDPKSGNLWLEQNGDDTFTELDLVQPGMNGGWIQVMGPLARIDQFKEIETTMFGGNLQQSRWPPTNIADSPEEALARMVMLPGAHYSDPEFSWKFEVAPAGIGFMNGRGIGPQYDGDLFVGAARPFLEGGFLWRFNLTGNRRKIAVDDPRLEDRVADNLNKPSADRPRGERPGPHREREPAVRPGLRRRHRHQDRPERQPVRRVALERRDLRDSSSVVTTNLFPSPSGPPSCEAGPTSVLPGC